MANETDPGPEPAGGTDYARYLLIDDLLGLQQPITPEAHDELLFIIVHQAYELWFKLMLHELERAEAELRAGRPHAAIPWLKRIVAIDRLFLNQLDVLETMGPEGFLEFRDPLAPASGFQSRQFREIEAACPGSMRASARARACRSARSTTRSGWRRSPTSTATTRTTRCGPPATRSASCSSTTTRRCSAGASTTR